MTLTSVELFAGAGGMALGLHRAGFRAVALVEQDADACATLRAVVEDGRLCGEVIEGDAATVDLSPFVGADLVAGGPPCQPFSAAGKGEGADDSRDGWPAFVRAVEIVRPRFILAENVRGFLFQKFDAYRLHIQRQLEALGYSLRVGLMNAADFGVPQTRQRVFIVGARDGEPPPWPVRTHHDPRKGRSLFAATAPWVSAGEAVGLGGMETLGGNPTRRDMRGESVRWGMSAASGGPAWKAGAADTVKGDGWSHQCRIMSNQYADGERRTRGLDEPAEVVMTIPPVVVGCPPELRRPAPAWFRGGWAAKHPASDMRSPVSTVVADHGAGSVNIVRVGGAPFRAPWQWRAAWQAFPVEVRGPGVVEVLWPFAGNRGAVDRQIGNAAPPRLVEALAGELR